MAMDVKLKNKKNGEEIVVLISHWENVLKKQGQFEVVDDGRNPREVIEEIAKPAVEKDWPDKVVEETRDTVKDHPEWYGIMPEGADEKKPEKKVRVKKKGGK